MYTDPGQVGHYAVSPEALRSGDPGALHRVLLATVMFQRLRDVYVLRILRSVPAGEVTLFARPTELQELADATPCCMLRSSAVLASGCDLSKDPDTKNGRCSVSPEVDCALKRHTEVLGRYGHFGKSPTSVALVLREAGVSDLAELYSAAVDGRTPEAASQWILSELSRAWRISEKIGSMFLSLVSNPDLFPGAPWTEGLDWRQFVVVDSNVDLFLGAVGYTGRRSYGSRAAFVAALARKSI